MIMDISKATHVVIADENGESFHTFELGMVIINDLEDGKQTLELRQAKSGPKSITAYNEAISNRNGQFKGHPTVDRVFVFPPAAAIHEEVKPRFVDVDSNGH
jgi:hypothetical protein